MGMGTEDLSNRIGDKVLNGYSRNEEGDASQAAAVLSSELNSLGTRNPRLVSRVESDILSDADLKPILPAIEIAYQKNRNGYSDEMGERRVSTSAVLADTNSEEPIVRESARRFQRSFGLESRGAGGSGHEDLSEAEVNKKIKELKREGKRNLEESSMEAVGERLLRPVKRRDEDLFDFLARRSGNKEVIERKDLDSYLSSAERYNSWRYSSSRYRRTHGSPVPGEEQIFFNKEEQKAVRTLRKLWDSQTVDDVASEWSGKKVVSRADIESFLQDRKTKESNCERDENGPAPIKREQPARGTSEERDGVTIRPPRSHNSMSDRPVPEARPRFSTMSDLPVQNRYRYSNMSDTREPFGRGGGGSASDYEPINCFPYQRQVDYPPINCFSESRFRTQSSREQVGFGRYGESSPFLRGDYAGRPNGWANPAYWGQAGYGRPVGNLYENNYYGTGGFDTVGYSRSNLYQPMFRLPDCYQHSNQRNGLRLRFGGSDFGISIGLNL